MTHCVSGKRLHRPRANATNANLTNEWQDVEVTGRMPFEGDKNWKPWMTAFWLRVDCHNETGQVFIDDVRITASGEKLALDQPSATASIVDEGAQVVADHFTTAWHAIDPAGIIFNPLTGGLLVSDSEVEEVTPYTDNLYSVRI